MAFTPNFGLPYPACPDCQPCPDCPGGLDAFENLARATDTVLATLSTSVSALDTRITSLETRVTALEALRSVFARKTADETVNNSAVMQNDDQLFVALAANTVYRIALDLVWSSGVTPDIKFDWTTPAGVAGLWTVTAVTGGATYFGSLGWAGVGNLDGTGADVFSRFEGILVTTAAGTLQFRWAQNVANASNTIVRTHSLLVATPLI